MGMEQAAPPAKQRGRITNFFLLHLVHGLMAASYSPFLVLFLTTRGVPNSRIGTILLLNYLLTFICQPISGMLSDRIGSVKRVFVSFLIAACATIPFIIIAKEAWLYFILVPVMSVLTAPLEPLAETWTLQGIKGKTSISFGAFRLFGSLGFTIMVAVAGWFNENAFVGSTFFLYPALGALTLVICFFIPVSGTPERKEGERARIRPGELLKNYHYATFLVCALIMRMSVSFAYTYLVQLMLAIGGSKDLHGYCLAVGAASEIPVFFLSGILVKRIKPIYLIMAAMLMSAAHITIASFAAAPAVLICAQVLQGIAYSVFVVGAVHYVDSHAPDEMKTSAQTLAYAVYFGIGGMVGNFFGGQLSESMGIIPVFRIAAGVAGIAFALLVLFTLLGKRLFPAGINKPAE